jgi:hypothetical protein
MEASPVPVSFRLETAGLRKAIIEAMPDGGANRAPSSSGLYRIPNIKSRTYRLVEPPPV